MLPEPIEPPVSGDQPPPRTPTLAERLVALIEVLICSDFPTQLALGATFAALGYRPLGPTGQLQIGFVVGFPLVDAVVLVGLIVFFLYSHGERPRDVFFGNRRIADEIAYGVPLIV